ncbi:MAG TPA: amino acid ABC transporter permease [Dongiaceae bacterium]|jgi:polar amino acid transport system permease protein|nr:amino acid ABC transporter permease [Dongiaceae bacterium]
MSELPQFASELWVSRWAIAQGLGTTILISMLAIVLGTILGTFVGLVLVYSRWVSRFLVRIYVDFVRGTPVFVLVLASFYLLSQIGIQLTAFQAGLFALVIFCSTHVGENLRGALLSLPRGQTEAAKAIGLTFPQLFVYVLAPQALRQALPAWINTATEMVKASTLLSVIGVLELLLVTKQIISRNFMSLEFYFTAGLIYFLIDYAIERAGKAVERRIALPT